MMLTGKHLIAGDWVLGETTFRSSPAHGAALEFSVGTPAHVDRAVRAAEAAFAAYSQTGREGRAVFLDRIADEIEARGAGITAIGTSATGLPAARLDGERGRTTAQLRLFAAHIRKGDYLDCRTDPALPDRQPAPRPEIRLMQQPIGPVAVFGASNFPLAFSTAGGDTASALAEAQSRQPPIVEPEPFDQDGIRTICYPGDPRHSVRQRAFPGPTRLMFKNKRFEPEMGLAALLDTASSY